MSDRLPAGPYRMLDLDGRAEVPFYVMPFDKRGLCQAPETRQHLLAALAAGGTSDVFLFSHGWNNDWTVATQRYERFIEGFMAQRRALDLPLPAEYRPLLVGIFWPSTSLVFTANERGPAIAAGQPAAIDAAVAEERLEVAAVAEGLAAEPAARFYELAQKPTLDEAEARDLAGIARSFYAIADDEVGLDTEVSVDDLLDLWAAATVDDLDEFIAAPAGFGVAGAGGFFRRLDPRPVVRALTVFMMKDRAGTVGAGGVHSLLADILAGSAARTHLLGHSYGGKVVLSATCSGTLPRPVTSMLLLQPAVSHLCFADKVPGTDRAGGYRTALERVAQPILSTFSRHDFALTKTFHLTLRRSADLGEFRIAAASPAAPPPSRFAALGGFGPRAAGERLVDILDPGAAYDLDGGVPVYGLDGSRTISGHGDISNPSTWWALHQLVAGSRH